MENQTYKIESGLDCDVTFEFKQQEDGWIADDVSGIGLVGTGETKREAWIDLLKDTARFFGNDIRITKNKKESQNEARIKIY
jgi:hypothetical protein